MGKMRSRDRREVRTQMIFQHSASAFNPRMTTEEIISETVNYREKQRREAK